jgi:hypothetical protein
MPAVKYLLPLLLFSGLSHATCTDYPAAHDLKRVEYRFEKIGASLKVVLDFPNLATHPTCTTTPVQWGVMWEFNIDQTDPVKVRVFDIDDRLVQSFSIYGPMELKVTSTRAAFRFYSSLTSKKILDHRLRSIELQNDSPIFALPSVEVDDGGTIRNLAGAKTIR